jgi:hypothetical protein
MAEELEKTYGEMRPVVTIVMNDGEDWADFEDLKKWEGEDKARRVAERIVDRDLDTFTQFMEQRGGEGLARPERAIVKTYLAWKLGLAQEQKENA